jgi:hypothetical protein
MSSTSGSFDVSAMEDVSLLFVFLLNRFVITEIRLIFDEEPTTFTLLGNNNLITWKELCTQASASFGINLSGPKLQVKGSGSSSSSSGKPKASAGG